MGTPCDAERAASPQRTAGTLHALLALLALAASLVALPPAAQAADPAVEAMRRQVEQLRRGGEPGIGAGSIAARTLVATLYERRGFAPLWSDPERQRALLQALRAADTHGLDPRDYHLAALDAPLPAGQRELLLTDALVRYAYHLYFGKADPRALQPSWNFSRTLAGVDPAAALARLIEAPDIAAALEGLAPRLPPYEALRGALASLRAAEAAGGWPSVDAGPALASGARGARVAQLRARLQAGGDLPAEGAAASGAPDPAAPDATFDPAVEEAVRGFQRRHGLEVDGVVGRATLAALNTPVRDRIDQVRANLERLRWVARDLEGDFLLVDIAGFSAHLWRHGALAWSARVVVGRPYRTTPEFRARMSYLVLNPEWNVPPTILREDVLPKVIADPGYLQRHRMRVLDAAGRSVDPAVIDWSRFRQQPRAFPYQIVQAAGGDNPLGRVKFMFPNEHAVYLHDTPSRALFDKTVRAFSSGCIRIDRPLELAVLLLDDPERWSMEQLTAAIATGQTRTVAVRAAVPVLLLYFTATVDADGTLQFRPDLYGRDRAIVAALAAPFRFAPVARH